jgi:dienelactone hydrolase
LESSRIPIELFGGALLVAGGGKDVEWPSAEMALNIAAQRPSANGPTTVLIYPEAGHGLAGPGTTPSGDLATLGGTPSALAEARAEVWAATFRLFQTSLKP